MNANDKPALWMHLPEVFEVRLGMNALRLEVPEAVANDFNALIFAAFHAIHTWTYLSHIEEAGTDALREAAIAGWNACRKSVYAICEDLQERAYDPKSAVPLRGLPTRAQEDHAKGFYSGGKDACRHIARGFNSMEAVDDDNFTAALSALASSPAASLGGEGTATNPRLTEHEVYYLNSILRMLNAGVGRVKSGPSLYSEALGDNRDWLEMFIESGERVFDKNDMERARKEGEEAGYDKAVADLRATPPREDRAGAAKALIERVEFYLDTYGPVQDLASEQADLKDWRAALLPLGEQG